ncbi:hypothetical protein T492DRAFT_862977, partial [Pavlovales sp. CCMP2436]
VQEQFDSQVSKVTATVDSAKAAAAAAAAQAEKVLATVKSVPETTRRTVVDLTEKVTGQNLEEALAKSSTKPSALPSTPLPPPPAAKAPPPPPPPAASKPATPVTPVSVVTPAALKPTAAVPPVVRTTAVVEPAAPKPTAPASTPAAVEGGLKMGRPDLEADADLEAQDE